MNSARAFPVMRFSLSFAGFSLWTTSYVGGVQLSDWTQSRMVWKKLVFGGGVLGFS